MAYLKGKVTLPDGRKVDARVRGRVWYGEFYGDDSKVEITLEDGTELSEEEINDDLDIFVYEELESSGVIWEDDYDPGY